MSQQAVGGICPIHIVRAVFLCQDVDAAADDSLDPHVHSSCVLLWLT